MFLFVLFLDVFFIGCVWFFICFGLCSGIVKFLCDGVFRVIFVGLEGDEQGDLCVYGGVEKVIYYYLCEYYVVWIVELGEYFLLMQVGVFGENFSISGWSEVDVCFGDCVWVGIVLLEVFQGCMFCWKFNDCFEVVGMFLRVQEFGCIGWYYWVLEEGVVVVGDIL